MPYISICILYNLANPQKTRRGRKLREDIKINRLYILVPVVGNILIYYYPVDT